MGGSTKLYTVSEISDMLNVHVETVRRWIRDGRIESLKGMGRQGSKVTKDALLCFLKDNNALFTSELLSTLKMSSTSTKEEIKTLSELSEEEVIEERRLYMDGDSLREKHLEAIEGYKIKLNEYIDSNITSERKAAIQKFISDTSFLSDPASIRHHGCHYGGLLKHCLALAGTALRLNRALKFNLSEESIVVCAILHDYCKIGTYRIGTRRTQDPEFANDKTRGYGWKTVNKYEYQNTEEMFYGHGMKSLMLIFKNLGYDYLDDDEKEAVAYHMGLFDEESKKDCMEVYAKNKLAYIIHCADVTASLYYEQRDEEPELIF